MLLDQINLQLQAISNFISTNIPGFFTVLGALIAFIGKWAWDSLVETWKRKRTASHVSNEIFAIRDHFISNIKVLISIREIDPPTIKRILAEKLLYNDKEFYATSIFDITYIPTKLSRHILKYRLLLRNNMVEIKFLIDDIDNKKLRRANIVTQRVDEIISRFCATVSRGDEIVEALGQYQRHPLPIRFLRIEVNWPDSTQTEDLFDVIREHDSIKRGDIFDNVRIEKESDCDSGSNEFKSIARQTLAKIRRPNAS